MARLKKKTLIQLLITVAVVAILIPLIEWKQAYEMLISIDLSYYSLLLAILMLSRWLMAYKWVILLKIKGIHISNMLSFKLYLIGGFWGEFLPTGFGVDLYRIHALTSRGESLKDSTSSIVVERILGFFSSTTFSFLAIVFVAFVFDNSLLKYLYPIFLALVIPILISLLLIRFPVTFHISRLFNKYQDTVVIKKVKSLYGSIMHFKSSPKQLWKFYFLSFIEQGFAPVYTFVAALALGFDVSFIYFLAIVPALFIMLRIPVSIQGIGVEEGLYIIFLTMIGLSTTEAFSLALLIRISRSIISLCGGLLYATETILGKFKTKALE